jgi:hypothetical protein
MPENRELYITIIGKISKVQNKLRQNQITRKITTNWFQQ